MNVDEFRAEALEGFASRQGEPDGTRIEIVREGLCYEGTDRFEVISQAPREELEVALRVILRFKACESNSEWLGCSSESWAKLEALEYQLERMIGLEGAQSIHQDYRKVDSDR